MYKDVILINLSTKYQQFVSDLEKVLKPELKSSVLNLRKVDLHDYFFEPDTWFSNETEAKGFVLSLFLKDLKKSAHN